MPAAQAAPIASRSSAPPCDGDRDAGAADPVAGADDRAASAALRGPARQEAGALGGRERRPCERAPASNSARVRPKAASSRSGPTNRAAASRRRRHRRAVEAALRVREGEALRPAGQPVAEEGMQPLRLQGRGEEAGRAARTERRAWGRRRGRSGRLWRARTKPWARTEPGRPWPGTPWSRAGRRPGRRGRARGRRPGRGRRWRRSSGSARRGSRGASGREPHLQDRAAPPCGPRRGRRRSSPAPPRRPDGCRRRARACGGRGGASGRSGSWCASGRGRGRC